VDFAVEEAPRGDERGTTESGAAESGAAESGTAAQVS